VNIRDFVVVRDSVIIRDPGMPHSGDDFHSKCLKGQSLDNVNVRESADLRELVDIRDSVIIRESVIGRAFANMRDLRRSVLRSFR
jgi:hypothetical protein